MILLIINTIITIFKCFFLSWLITRFEPIKNVLSSFFVKAVDYLPHTIKMQTRWLKITGKTLTFITCLRCISFWTTLIITGNIFIAAIVCFMGVWYTKLFKKKEEEWRPF